MPRTAGGQSATQLEHIAAVLAALAIVGLERYHATVISP